MEKYIDSFLEMMEAERGSSPRTIEAYKHDLEDLSSFLAANKKKLENAENINIRSYIVHLKKRDLASKTQLRRLSAIREFFLFLFSEGIREDNPVAGIESPSFNKPLPKYLTVDEVQKLIGIAKEISGKKSIRMVAILELLYASGIRVSELVGLPLSAVASDKSIIIVRGKGNKERIVPLSIPARTAIKEYISTRNTYLKKGRKSR